MIGRYRHGMVLPACVRRARLARALLAATGALAAMLATAALTACSDSGAPGSNDAHPGTATASMVDGVQVVHVRASDFRFRPSTIVVHPGKVRIVLDNVGAGSPHDWQMPDFPSDSVGIVSAGHTLQSTFVAPSPGTYTFVCTLHVREGMTGKLVVLPK